MARITSYNVCYTKLLRITLQLIDAITELSLEYATEQAARGVSVFQLFETHAGLVPQELYMELFMPAVRKIAQRLRDLQVPFIFFPKGLGTGICKLTPDDCDYLGVDWQTSLIQARQMVHREIGLQGNVDPRLLYAPPESILRELDRLIDFGSCNTNWILNLGHGFLPDTPYESACILANWIKETNWKR